MSDKGIYLCSFERIDTGGSDLRKFELKVVSRQTTPPGPTDNHNTICEYLYVSLIVAMVTICYTCVCSLYIVANSFQGVWF